MGSEYTGTWLNTKQSWEYMGITSPTFYRWKNNDPDFPKPNKYKCYLDLDLMAYMSRRAVQLAPAVER